MREWREEYVLMNGGRIVYVSKWREEWVSEEMEGQMCV